MHRVKYRSVKYSPVIRNLIQAGWGIFLLYIGWQFFLFVRYFETQGATGYTSRPPAAEGFLPAV